MTIPESTAELLLMARHHGVPLDTDALALLAEIDADALRNKRVRVVEVCRQPLSAAIQQAVARTAPVIVRVPECPGAATDRFVGSTTIRGTSPGSVHGFNPIGERTINGRREQHVFAVGSFGGFLPADIFADLEKTMHAGIRRELVISKPGANLADLASLRMTDDLLETLIGGFGADARAITTAWWASLGSHPDNAVRAVNLRRWICRNGSLDDPLAVIEGNVIDCRMWQPTSAEAAE